MDYPPSVSTSYEALALARANPWIAAVVGWVDLADPGVGNALDELCQFPLFKGTRHIWQSEPDPGWIMRPDVLRGLRALACRNLTFDLLVKPHNWPYISQVAAAVPDLRLVINHIGKPEIRWRQFDDWADMMQQAAKFPQMMVKLSGMITEADWQHWQPADLRPYVTTTIELFGVDRVMFGSDWPVCLLAGSYSQVLSTLRECLSDLAEVEQSLVLGANARTFYGIA
jgi:L-fuconolactonase